MPLVLPANPSFRCSAQLIPRMFHVEHPLRDQPLKMPPAGFTKVGDEVRCRSRAERINYSSRQTLNEYSENAPLFHVERPWMKSSQRVSNLVGGKNPESLQKSKIISHLSSRRHFFLFSNQEISLERFRYQNWLSPFPIPISLYFLHIPPANPKDDLACLNLLRASPFKKWTKFANRSRANIVDRRNFFSQLLIAADQHPAIR